MSISNLVDPVIASIPNTLFNALSQVEQNGGGNWGRPSPCLPKWVGGPDTAINKPSNSTGRGAPYPITGGNYGNPPWGGMTPRNRNPYTSYPDSGGQTRSYDFTIAECTIAPDGVQLANEVCVNGQFPGPLIEANYGDWIEVTVHNELEDEGTALHWHGLLQKGTQWYDGVPSVGQCPIAPGQTYTYRFQAELYGSSWYHSHYSGQYAGGALGPMIFYGPDDHGEAIDIGPVMLQDWYHNNYSYLIAQTMAPNAEQSVGGPNAPLSQNNLINGKMNYECSKTNLPCTPNAGISKFNFTSGATHKLRLINTGAQAIQKFSIDGHNMTVVANDYVPVEPYTTNIISLGIGQRADILVNGTGKRGDAYWMRSNIAGCSNNDGISPLALAAIYYDDADQTIKPTTSANVDDSAQRFCANDPLQKTIPTFPINAPDPSVTEEIRMELKFNGTHNLYYMNGVSFRSNYNNPLLRQTHDGNLTYATQDAVHNYGTNATVRLVVLNYDTQFHPMHLHGHNIQVLDVGFGPWTGTVVRPDNPQRRDVQLMPPGSPAAPSHMVIQWYQDNPGIWPFHCHIAWHLSAGLYFNVLENPDEIQNGGSWRGIDRILDQTCRGWDEYSRNNVVYQIDGGQRV